MIAGYAATLTGLLADATPSPSPTMRQFTDSDFGTAPGMLSLLAFVLLAAAVIFLWRSMNKQLKRIRPEEDRTDAVEPGPGDASATDAAPDDAPANGAAQR